jgi:hypothetical protein
MRTVVSNSIIGCPAVTAALHGQLAVREKRSCHLPPRDHPWP